MEGLFYFLLLVVFVRLITRTPEQKAADEERIKSFVSFLKSKT